ncbi:MAG: efflux RND transporter permease subunit [Deferrisomatales bacterium]|nr:efflux RND transporter permease subunit [Deferrisomatales bacterium]
MIITQFSIRHFMAVLVMCLGIVLLGSAAYVTMPRENFPDVKVPVVTVTTVYEGANPTDVEISVTVPLETELDGVEGLEKLNSTSAEGLSVIKIEFDPEVDTQVALARIRDAVDKAKGDLPGEADEPIVKEFSFSGDVPVMVLNLVGAEEIALSELKDLADKVEDEIKRLPGVLDVKIRGGRDREVLIEVDPERLRFYDLPLAQVQGILRGTNRNVSAGVAEGGTNRIVMRAPGEFRSPAEIFSLVVGAGPDGTPVYMRDVANVRFSFADETYRARLYDFTNPDGETSVERHVEPRKSVSIEVMKKSGENILALSDAVHELVEHLDLPPEVQIVVALDLSKDVRSMIADLENGIGTSLLLVLLVIFIGLGARNAFLVAWAIPFSMLLSIATLNLLDITLNMMVLYSLILALGMLVDNAIVIVENIYRHYSLGLTRPQAALKGTTEVAWPVITSTATTVGAFFPMVFWPGVMGEFMGFLPKTVIIVLTSSLFVALVINPTLCALVMKRKAGAVATIDPETQRPTYALVRWYGGALEFMLDRPVWTLSTSFTMLVLVLCLYGVFGAGTEFFPAVDPNLVIGSIKPPEGVSLEESDRLSRAFEDRIFGRPGSGYATPVPNLKHATVTVGLEEGGGGFGEEGLGPIKIRIQFVDREFRGEPSTLTLAAIRNRAMGLDADGTPVVQPLFGAEFDVVKPQEGPPTGKPVSIDVYGDDLNVMTAVIRDMKGLMEETPGVAKPTDDAVTAQPTLEWSVDRARAGMLGLEQASVGSALQMAVGGLRTGTLGHGDDEQDILVRLPERYRLDTGRLGNVTIPTSLGGAVPIDSVASAELVPGPVAVKHYQRRRVLNAGAEVQPWVRADADVRAAFQEKVAGYPFPPGITYRFGGAAEEEAESTAFLINAFFLALFIIAMVLVLQFNSMLVPAIVMCSVLLSLIGVFTGLLAFDMPFGIIMSGIGVISLAGVVVNNAIVLLDAIRLQQERGLPARDAVVTAGMIRFRPVLLTAITTMLGLLPMALKFNIDFLNLTYQYNTESSQWWQSMAVAIIFGLLVATVLTLGVVPTLYMLYSKFRLWLFTTLGWKVAKEMDIMGIADELAALEKARGGG